MSKIITSKKELLKAIENDGGALKFASEELQGDKEVVLKAIENNGWTLKFASEELKGDKEVVCLRKIPRRYRSSTKSS